MNIIIFQIVQIIAIVLVAFSFVRKQSIKSYIRGYNDAKNNKDPEYNVNDL